MNTQELKQFDESYKWWVTNPPSHVGNNSVHRYDGFGYYDLEGAQACLDRCNALDYVGKRVVE